MESANEVHPCPAAVCQMSPQCSLGDTSMASNSSRGKKKSDFCIQLVGPGPGVRSEKQVNKGRKDRWKKGEARKDLESWEGNLSQLCTPKSGSQATTCVEEKLISIPGRMLQGQSPRTQGIQSMM